MGICQTSVVINLDEWRFHKKPSIRYEVFFYVLFINLMFIIFFVFVDAVRKRFGFKEEDMKSIWTTIRTSLVQKVNDIRKSNRCKSQQQRQSQEIQQQSFVSLSTNPKNGDQSQIIVEQQKVVRNQIIDIICSIVT